MAVLKTVRYSYFQPDCIKLLSSSVCTFSFHGCFLHASAEEQGVCWQESPDVMQMVRTGRVRLEKRSSLWLSVASSVPVACVLVLWADRKLLVFLLCGWVAAEGHTCSLSRMNISQNFLLLSHWWLCDNLNFWGGETNKPGNGGEVLRKFLFLPTHTFCVEKWFLLLLLSCPDKCT